MNSGINLTHVKSSVRPQDDLYRHVNGTWIDSAEIPADRSSDGAFYELYQNAEQHVREIIEALGASGGAKVICMDHLWMRKKPTPLVFHQSRRT